MNEFPYSVGQGALGIECRVDNTWVRDIISCLEDRVTAMCVISERSMLNALQGGCQVPIGVQSWMSDNTLHLRGEVISLDGKILYTSEKQVAECVSMDIAESLGLLVARELIEQGASSIIGDLTSKRPITYGNA